MPRTQELISQSRYEHLRDVRFEPIPVESLISLNAYMREKVILSQEEPFGLPIWSTEYVFSNNSMMVPGRIHSPLGLLFILWNMRKNEFHSPLSLSYADGTTIFEGQSESISPTTLVQSLLLDETIEPERRTQLYDHLKSSENILLTGAIGYDSVLRLCMLLDRIESPATLTVVDNSRAVLDHLERHVPIALGLNCSKRLVQIAFFNLVSGISSYERLRDQLGVAFDTVISDVVGWYCTEPRWTGSSNIDHFLPSFVINMTGVMPTDKPALVLYRDMAQAPGGIPRDKSLTTKTSVFDDPDFRLFAEEVLGVSITQAHIAHLQSNMFPPVPHDGRFELLPDFLDTFGDVVSLDTLIRQRSLPRGQRELISVRKFESVVWRRTA